MKLKTKPLIRSTSDRQFSGRTDSLSPKAMEQVKEEVGDTTPVLIVSQDDDISVYHLVNPTTKLPYDLSEITSENVQTLFEQIEQDYPFLKFENVESEDICKIIGSFKVDLILFDDTLSRAPIEVESWLATRGNLYYVDEILGEESGGTFPIEDIVFYNISEEEIFDFHLNPSHNPK